ATALRTMWPSQSSKWMYSSLPVRWLKAEPPMISNFSPRGIPRTVRGHNNPKPAPREGVTGLHERRFDRLQNRNEVRSGIGAYLPGVLTVYLAEGEQGHDYRPTREEGDRFSFHCCTNLSKPLEVATYTSFPGTAGAEAGDPDRVTAANAADQDLPEARCSERRHTVEHGHVDNDEIVVQGTDHQIRVGIPPCVEPSTSPTASAQI